MLFSVETRFKFQGWLCENTCIGGDSRAASCERHFAKPFRRIHSRQFQTIFASFFAIIRCVVLSVIDGGW